MIFLIFLNCPARRGWWHAAAPWAAHTWPVSWNSSAGFPAGAAALEATLRWSGRGAARPSRGGARTAVLGQLVRLRLPPLSPRLPATRGSEHGCVAQKHFRPAVDSRWRGLLRGALYGPAEKLV